MLLAIIRHPAATMREIAGQVGITERAVQRLVRDLVDAGYVERSRNGRANAYVVHLDKNLPHPTTCLYEVDDLFGVLRAPRH